ncbi:hypothetical protein D9757_013476 [Collybiopsis confluens]|uniref:Peptide hydrolase n=1 Tax=Collybiopsis confluens TaxID=2823264 RepID=A0A8H5FQH6_9AGAR|nr:hypothetical protein D9757_013476 [Collybiopsis confluens]
MNSKPVFLVWLFVLLQCTLGQPSFIELSTREIKALIKDPDPLEGIDRHLGKIMIPRVSDTLNNTVVQMHIITTLKDLEWHIHQDSFESQTPLGVKKFVNIVATKDIRASRRVVLSAHYDSRYLPPPNEGLFVGATDSAFPCAVLLDLAESLNGMLERRSNEEDDADTTLQLVFFDGEEAFVRWTSNDSLYGSRNLAGVWSSTLITPDSPSAVTIVDNPKEELDSDVDLTLSKQRQHRLSTPSSDATLLSTIEHFILLDILGAKDPKIKSFFNVRNSLRYPRILSSLSMFRTRPRFSNDLKRQSIDWVEWMLSFTEMASSSSPRYLLVRSTHWSSDKKDTSMSSTNYTSYFLPIPRIPDPNETWYMDDHIPFLKKGVRVLHLIPENFPEVWHTIGDDASVLDRMSMRRWDLIMRVFIAEYLHLRGQPM